MRKQSLSLIVVGLFLSAVSGCRKPVDSVIILPSNGNASYPYAEKGGSITFVEENESEGFTVSFPDGVCEGTSPITSHLLPEKNTESATCHIIGGEGKLDTFTIQRKSTNPKVPPPPPEPIETYIRSCPPGSKKGC